MCQSEVIQDIDKENSFQMTLLHLLLCSREKTKSSFLPTQAITGALPIWLVNPLLLRLIELKPHPASLLSVHLPSPPSIRNDPSRTLLSCRGVQAISGHHWCLLILVIGKLCYKTAFKLYTITFTMSRFMLTTTVRYFPALTCQAWVFTVFKVE